MTTTTSSSRSSKFNLASIMRMAWTFVRNCGYTMSEALKCAWRNAKLKSAMFEGVVRFSFQKVDGSIRQAFGTLKNNLVPATGGNRRYNPTLQTYFDTEKQEWRCFKVANLLHIG